MDIIPLSILLKKTVFFAWFFCGFPQLYFKQKMETMETKTEHNQLVIKTSPDNEKQKLPLNIVLTMTAGTVAGMAIIFCLFWGAEKLLGF